MRKTAVILATLATLIGGANLSAQAVCTVDTQNGIKECMQSARACFEECKVENAAKDCRESHGSHIDSCVALVKPNIWNP